MILPGLRDLVGGLERHPAFQDLVRVLGRAEPKKLQLSGLNATGLALYATLLHVHTERTVAVVVGSSAIAEVLVETAAAFFELLEVSTHRVAPFVLPAHDVTPYDGLSPHAEISEKRGIGLWRMADQQASLVAAPVASALLQTASADFLRNFCWKIEVGDEFDLADLEEGLEAAAFVRHEPVETVGQFSLRGGIIDIYSPEASYPVRLEMFGDQVESIRHFDPNTQKSVQSIEKTLILPLTEYPLSAGLRAEISGHDGAGSVEAPSDDPILPPGWEFHPAGAEARSTSLWQLLDRPVIIWSDRASLEAEAEKVQRRLQAAFERSEGPVPSPEAFYLSLERLREPASGFHQIEVERLAHESGSRSFHISTQPTPRFGGNIAHCMRELQARVKDGSRVLVVVPSLGDVERLADVLNEYGITYQLALRDPSKAGIPYLEEKAYLAGPVSQTVLAQASIREGAVFTDSHVVIYGVEDIFSASTIVARPPQRKSAVSTFLADLEDLKPGDLVVHYEHGIGRYLGQKQIEHGSRQEDFMLIEYADRARLYVPLARLDLVQRHHGAGGTAPPLDRMGGQTWSRTKSRVKARLVDMADELLKLYAERKLKTGFAFSADSNWQREFEDAFEFVETPDQLHAVRDIKKDMESPETMDRLVCGDVGFGKTEVAMRAAFKALADGKQVALLAPTTVLALQHYETFRQRFSPFPVEVEMLTRFRTARRQKEIIDRVAAGKVDLTIGTHRLLSKDVVFNDLGLLIVDEEQRFGVRHKERLKQLKKNVDVLTLTATPIPRTLHMSFVGLRDMSIIQTPPKDRLAIQTVVAPYSDRIVRAAIEQEIERGGQIFFVHNRVETIWGVAAHLQQLVPGVRFGVGHGQMPARDLEDVMVKFMRHEYDVLVSTTIVENGLDIPLANTMMIDRADRYGLAELYQLRGRVGRSDRRAYAYLLVDDLSELSEDARKRLAALKEFSELGSGFKIAALDLELRGAGNLLGAEQHGHIGAVGFETYCRILDEAVAELQGEKKEAPRRATIKLQLDVHIPTDYITDEAQRLQAYKNLAEIRNAQDQERVEGELRDRYGTPPEPVRNLMDYALIKSQAEQMRIERIERRGQRLALHFLDDSAIDPRRLMDFVRSTPEASFSPSGELTWALADEPGPKWLSATKGLLDRLAAA